MVLVTLALLLLGAILGTALNYLADVLPATRSFSAIQCSHCAANRSAENFILFKACAHCGERRNARALLVVILSTILTPLAFYFPPDRFGFWVSLPYFFYYALIVIIDIEHHAILNETIWAGIVLAIPLGLVWNNWQSTLLGAAGGFGIMGALYLAGILFNRIISKKRGAEIEEVALGYGDVNLSLVNGILLGWPKIGYSVFFSVLIGGLASALVLIVSLARHKYQAFTAIPYAPFLAISALILIYMA